MTSAIVKVDTRHYRKIAQENWGLTNEQMKGMDVHHRLPQSLGGTNDPSNLYVCSPSYHAHAWHSGGTLKNCEPWIKAVCTPEAREKSWNSRKDNWSEVSKAGGTASAKAKRDQGITSWGFENTTLGHRILGGKVSSRTLFMCPQCGMKANGGNIARHQKASGHTGDKIKVHLEPV